MILRATSRERRFGFSLKIAAGLRLWFISASVFEPWSMHDMRGRPRVQNGVYIPLLCVCPEQMPTQTRAMPLVVPSNYQYPRNKKNTAVLITKLSVMSYSVAYSLQYIFSTASLVFSEQTRLVHTPYLLYQCKQNKKQIMLFWATQLTFKVSLQCIFSASVSRYPLFTHNRRVPHGTRPVLEGAVHAAAADLFSALWQAQPPRRRGSR